MKKTTIKKVAFLAAVFFVSAGVVLATGRTDFQEEEIFLLESEIVDGDYLGASGVIDVTGTINGDVMVAGGIVNFSGKSAGDILAVGGEIKISGEKEGNVRAAGGSLLISGNIPKNVTVAGGSVIIEKDSIVGGSAYIAGGNVEIRGDIKEDIKMAGGRVLLSGNVDGDAEIWADEISIRPNAKINGNLVYHSNQEISIGENIVAGEITRKSLSIKEKKEGDFWEFIFGFEVMKFVGFLILALILYKFFCRNGKEIFVSMEKKPWENLAIGVFAVIFVPVLLIILLISLIGWPLMLFILFSFALSLMVSKIVAMIVVGHLISRRFKERELTEKFPWMDFVLGYIALAILWLIPVLGWLAVCLISAWALGGVVWYGYRKMASKE